MSMHPRHPASGPSEDPFPGGGTPLPREANPSWMGQVQPGNYRSAPGHQGHPVDTFVPPQVQGTVVRAGRARSGSLVALTIGGSALAFLSLFLVVPFLLSNTGAAGFLIGFLASLIPLSVV